MMVENDAVSKENSVPNTVPNSDDSYSGFSLPWFPTQTKRKSRLGMRQRDRIRVLQDIVPNVSSELKPLTLNQDLSTESGGLPSEIRSISPMCTSVPTFDSAPHVSTKFNYFEQPAVPAQSPSFDALEPIFNEFKLPSLSPHSAPMGLFDLACSSSSPSATTRTSFESMCVSPPPSCSSKTSFDSVCLSPPPSSSKTSFESMCVSPPSAVIKTSSEAISVPSVPSSLKKTCFESLCSSPPPSVLRKTSFDTRCVSPSPQSAFKKISSEPICLPSVAKISSEPAHAVSPVKPASNVLQPSNSYNTNLKSSLRKPLSPLTGNEEPPVKPTALRKEVRFVEPAPPPPPSTTFSKRTEDLPAHITVKNKTYRINRELGRGGSCVVYEVSDPDKIDTLAIKKVILPEDEEFAYVADGYLQEVKMLEKLQSYSDVIIKMFDYQLVYENGCRVLFVVLEKGEMDLSKAMRGIDKELKLYYIILYWRLMLKAVDKIHDEDIIHMDLKPANFLLVKNQLKLIDFGIASSMPKDKTSIYLEATSGTLSYTSPEALFVPNPSNNTSGNRVNELPVPSGHRISKRSDVWSLGCILYQWIYGHVPFHKSVHKWQRFYDIITPEKEVDFPEQKEVPESLIRLCKMCLQKDPKKRPTVKELLQSKLKVEILFD